MFCRPAFDSNISQYTEVGEEEPYVDGVGRPVPRRTQPVPRVPCCGCCAQPGASTGITGGPGAPNPRGVPRLSAATSPSPGSVRGCVRGGPGHGRVWAVPRMLRQVRRAPGWISCPRLTGRWVMPSVRSTARCCGTARCPPRPAALASAQLGTGRAEGVPLPEEFSAVKAFVAGAKQIQPG